MAVPRPNHIQRQIDAGKAAFEAAQKGEPIPGLDVPLQEAPQEAQGAPPSDEGEHPDTMSGYDPDPPPGGSREEPGPTSPPAGDPPSEEPPEDADPLAKARHAAQTWRGRYRADVAKLSKQVEELTATTTAQFNAIAKLQAQLVEAPPSQASAVPAAAQASKPLVTAEEREQYGEEFSNYIEKLAQQIADRQVQAFASQVDDRLKNVTGQVEQFGKRTQKQLEQEFYRDLDRLVPDWRNLNEDVEFNQWLTQSDPFSGEVRKNLLVNACEWADSARAARFFTGFLAEQEAVNPGTRVAPTSSNGDAGRKVLEGMASPGRPRQPASREAPAPEKISDRDVRQFYTDVTKGHYKNRPQEKADAIRRIEAALLRGDITPMQ
jgi:hypothetical protein